MTKVLLTAIFKARLSIAIEFIDSAIYLITTNLPEYIFSGGELV